MKKMVELPLIEPMYSTYHYQGAATAVLKNNPSIRNYYLNQVVMLTCNRKFLKGYTSPEVEISGSSWDVNPYLSTRLHALQFLNSDVHGLIRRHIDAGYYVCFNGVDDYYVEGKSWYRERHFFHDGLICGYNQEDKTYCIYAYDKDWRYQKFWTSQKSFEKGIKSAINQGVLGYICGIKPKDTQVIFSPKTSIEKIEEYLDSTDGKYCEDSEELVCGISVYDYIAKYLGKLYDSSIPYERMDRRVFRMIWEHKKVMLERILAIENALGMDGKCSDCYTSVVKSADNMRMLYASHHRKRRDSVLVTLQREIIDVKRQEQDILNELIYKAKGIYKYDTVEST